MRKTLLPLLLVGAVLLAAAAPASRGARAQNPCGIPDRQPLWIDFGDGSVPFWSTVFKRPRLVVAASGLTVTPQYRAAGVPLVYFDLYLNNRVGTPSQPADPAAIDTRADALFKRAVESSGCDHPFIALNELFGSSVPTPWTPTTAQYRANVLAFLQGLVTRGAKPFLLLSSRPYTGGEAADWWRQVAQYADIVPEVYFNAPMISKAGAIAGNRRLRVTLRQRIHDFLDLGIPASRLGFMLGFQSAPGAGGREGLKPAEKWFEVVKWEALAAKQVARELKIASVWSWGWAAFSAAGQDPDKEAAACVYLWARDQSLCDGPAAGGDFDTSSTEGQLVLPPGAICTIDSTRIPAQAVSALARLTGDRDAATTALLERAVESEVAPVATTDVLAAERFVVTSRFRGSRGGYLAALAKARASVPIARGVLADELRRLRLEQRFDPPAASSAAIAAYYQTYGDTPGREIAASEPIPWLGGKTHGVALPELAPPQVFVLSADADRTVRNLAGAYRIRAVGETSPLGAFPLALARPAIGLALARQAQANALHLWLVRRMAGALNRSTCVGDDLPEVADLDLVDFLPFLALS